MSGQQQQQGWPEGCEAARELVAEVARTVEEDTAPPVGARSRVWSAVGAARAASPWCAWLRPALGAAALVVVVLSVLVVRNATAPSTLAGARFDATEPRRLDVHGAAQVVLDEGTRASLPRDDANALAFALERGSLLADVEHRPAGAPFLVQTPRATVKVVGTVLWVSVDATGEATVLVGRGAVEVQPLDGRPPVKVAAGERWPARSSRTPSAGQLRLLSDRLDGARFAPGHDVTAAAGAASEASGATPPHQSAPSATEVLQTTRGSCSALSGAAAVSCLRALSNAADPLRAESALFEMGWRQLRDLGDARAALATWTAQRQRFPRGVLRAEADTGVVQAALKLGDRALARREAEAWLAAHDGGLAAAEVHFLLGSVEHADGHCARALPHFEAALRSPAEPWARDARAQRAACLHERR